MQVRSTECGVGSLVPCYSLLQSMLMEGAWDVEVSCDGEDPRRTTGATKLCRMHRCESLLLHQNHPRELRGVVVLRFHTERLLDVAGVRMVATQNIPRVAAPDRHRTPGQRHRFSHHEPAISNTGELGLDQDRTLASIYSIGILYA